MNFRNNFSVILKGTVKCIQSAFLIYVFTFCLSRNSFSQNLKQEFLLSGNHVTDSLKKKTPQKPAFRMKKDPWKAVLYSSLLPGAGQVYNKSYWKVPVIAGLGGYFIYGIVSNNNKYLDYKSEYQNSQTEQNPAGNPQLQYLREFYRDERDNFIVYSLILYLINIIDAYVDAQLYDFDVSDKVKFGFLQREKLASFKFLF